MNFVNWLSNLWYIKIIMKYKILFCIALPAELKIVKNEIKKLNILWLDIKFLLIWVWNYNVIYSVKDYISNNSKPDFIVNLWVCWHSLLEIIDVIQVYRIKNLSNDREEIVPLYLNLYKLESILSSEKVIIDKKNMLWENFVDMESYWINYICNKEKINFIIIKVPFDLVWAESKNVSINSMIRKLEKKLYLINNQKKDIDLSFYKNYFSFTFSEFEIFKKNYKKFLAFWIDFDDFFERNNFMDKKTFLKYFSNYK
jgi:hypothetical protein